jgi:cadmium resistance protein CadD (predicted permease)
MMMFYTTLVGSSANVAFLAVPVRSIPLGCPLSAMHVVTIPFLAAQNISALPQTASLCSILFSMLSMVIGVHHVWRHRRRADADDDEAVRAPSQLILSSAHKYFASPIFQSQYLRVRSHGERGDLTLLACFLALPLAALLWAILSFTVAISALCFSSAAGADVHMRALFAGVLGVLLSLAVLTLLVFWDAWRSPPTTEPEEDYARGVGAKKPGRKGWLKHARRRMKIVRADAMDGMQIRMKMRTVVRRAVITVNPMTLEDSDVRATRSLGIAGTENTADV